MMLRSIAPQCPSLGGAPRTEGLLAHVRIVNVIRVRPNDLTRFVAERALERRSFHLASARSQP